MTVNVSYYYKLLGLNDLLKKCFICLLERQTNLGERERRGAPTHLFTLQMPTTATVVPGGKQSGEHNPGVLCGWQKPNDLPSLLPLEVFIGRKLESTAKAGNGAQAPQGGMQAS